MLVAYVFFLEVKLLIPVTLSFMSDEEDKKHYS